MIGIPDASTMVSDPMVGAVTSCRVRRYVSGMSSTSSGPFAVVSDVVEVASPSAALSRAAEQNLAVAMSLRATAWQLAEAGLRTFRPELSEDDVQVEVRALFRRTSG